MEVDNIKHLQFKHPFTAIAAGPSGSGKTYLVRDVLENFKLNIANIDKGIIDVVWAHGIWQKIYHQPIKNVNLKYIEGLPDEEDVLGYDVIVIDDLMSELKNNKFVLDLFTKGSHHNHQSVILLTQNLYHKGNIVRDLNLNCNYLIIFKSPRDKMQIMTLAKQTNPNDYGYFMSAYEQATYPPHGYLVVDFKQDTPENLRLKTRIIPSEETDWKFKPFGFLKR